MTNPVVVEVLRGGRVESAHRGAGAVVDADGRIALSFGDLDRPVYPRSAVKALQALPLIESGAADRLGLSDAEIALACASHSGEAEAVGGAAFDQRQGLHRLDRRARVDRPVDVAEGQRDPPVCVDDRAGAAVGGFDPPAAQD